MTYNIPTILALLFAALCQTIERAGHKKPLPNRTTSEELEKSDPLCAKVTIGKHTVELQRHARELVLELTTRERIYFFALLPKIIIGCFALARRDYVKGLNLGLGHFALVHITDEKPDTLRRLTKACGLDPDRPRNTARVELGVKVLRAMTLKIGDNVTIEGLLSGAGTLELKSKQIDEGAHRGGLWHIEALHPALCELMLTRFAQLEERALELRPRLFNVWCAILGHRFLTQGLKKKTITKIRLDVHRLIRDGALSETTRRGDARERSNLFEMLEKLQAAGFLDSWELSESRHQVTIWFEPPTLAQNPTSTSNLGAPDPPQPPTLAHPPSKTLMKGQESKDSGTPVRTLSSKSSSSLAPPQGGGAKRGKGQKREKRRRKGVRTRKK